MALIDDIHSIINFATDKGVTGYHKPEDIDNEIHAVSTDIWQKFFDEYAETKKISGYMAPFEVVEELSTNNGVATMTKEIEHATLVMAAGREVKITERFQWGGASNDVVSPPSDTYPICVFASKANNLYIIDVLPLTITGLTIYGLRKPKKPVWTYNIVSGRKVFNETGTYGGTFQDIEWTELIVNDIRNRVLKVMGINLREQHIAQFAELMKADTE